MVTNSKEGYTKQKSLDFYPILMYNKAVYYILLKNYGVEMSAEQCEILNFFDNYKKKYNSVWKYFNQTYDNCFEKVIREITDNKIINFDDCLIFIKKALCFVNFNEASFLINRDGTPIKYDTDDEGNFIRYSYNGERYVQDEDGDYVSFTDINCKTRYESKVIASDSIDGIVVSGSYELHSKLREKFMDVFIHALKNFKNEMLYTEKTKKFIYDYKNLISLGLRYTPLDLNEDPSNRKVSQINRFCNERLEENLPETNRKNKESQEKRQSTIKLIKETNAKIEEERQKEERQKEEKQKKIKWEVGGRNADLRYNIKEGRGRRGMGTGKVVADQTHNQNTYEQNDYTLLNNIINTTLKLDNGNELSEKPLPNPFK